MKKIDIPSLVFVIIVASWVLLGICWGYRHIWGYPEWAHNFLSWLAVDINNTKIDSTNWLIYGLFGPVVAAVFYITYGKHKDP